MVEPHPHHLLPVDNLSSQYSISNGLFCLMLETTTNRVGIGRSCATICNDIDIAEAQDLARQNRQVRNEAFTPLKDTVSYSKK